MNEKVSVIVPVYNIQKYIDECVMSLIGQSYDNLEIILVDDGSVDASGEICDHYAALDSRVKVIHQSNGGAGSAKNVALNAATGNYIAFVDGDDYTRPEYIRKLVEMLESSGADISECGFYNQRKSLKTPVDNAPEGVFSAESFLRRFLVDWKCSLLWNKLFKRTLLDHLRFYEGRVIDDEFYTYKAVMAAKTVVVFNEPLYVYRQRKTGVTNQGRWKQRLLDRLAYYTERYDLVTASFSSLKPQYLHDLADNLMRIKHETGEFPELTKETNQAMRKYLLPVVLGSVSVKMKYSYLLSLLKKPAANWHSDESPDWDDFYD